MRDSEIAGNLLSVEKMKGDDLETHRLYPIVAALLNLFFCAYTEHSLTEDVGGFGVTLFLFTETAVIIVLSTISFVTTAREILLKTRIFPMTPSARLLFVLAADLRRPLTIALAGSTAFFLFVALQQHMVQAITAVVMFLMLIAVAEAIYATAILGFLRRSIPVESVIAALGALLVLSLIGSIVFRVESLFGANPLLHWTQQGILAAGHDNTTTILENMLYLALTGLGTIAIGRRLA
jgi:hypothetical protein